MAHGQCGHPKIKLNNTKEQITRRNFFSKKLTKDNGKSYRENKQKLLIKFESLSSEHSPDSNNSNNNIISPNLGSNC